MSATNEPTRLRPDRSSPTRRYRSLVGSLRGEGTAARRAWRNAYVNRIAAGDFLCAAAAASVGYLVRFGPKAGPFPTPTAPIWVALLLPFVWGVTMLAARAYEQRFLWIGPEEYHRVFQAATLLLAVIGTMSWAFKLEVARGFVVLALPLATVFTLIQRFVQRNRLNRARRHGRYSQTALLVGHRNAVRALHAQLERESHQGYRPVGCCLPADQCSSSAPTVDGLPVLGNFDDVIRTVRKFEVDSVAVLPSPELDGAALRRLGWGLENTQAELLLAPAVTEIVGPRVRIRPVCGLPLLHMERPELRGIRRLTKEAVDRVGATLALLLLAPVLISAALAVRLTGAGPVLFRQTRVGRDGRPFSMLKFRTMVQGADAMVAQLRGADEGNGVLFKIREDPRVTRVGRILRRYSLDELPQLLNVLHGDMSLVGPRPPLQSEVERYGLDMHRRFLVKPGMTGLWQISGRSDLSWDDCVRMDVRYVENWTLAFDLMILWKTVGAIRRGSGAY